MSMMSRLRGNVLASPRAVALMLSAAWVFASAPAVHAQDSKPGPMQRNEAVPATVTAEEPASKPADSVAPASAQQGAAADSMRNRRLTTMAAASAT